MCVRVVACARRQGKKEFHLSRKAKKEMILTEKFKELESKGQGAVDKYMEKKRKKKASKDKRALPWGSASRA